MIDPRLDPKIREILEQVEATGGPPLETLSPPEARQAAIDGLAEWRGDAETVAGVENRTIPGPASNIPIRIYNPEGQAPFPALIYFHGGGWVVCDLDTHDIICRAITRRSGAVVIAVDYRLAPEHKFPAAVDDCYAATCWVATHAAELGIDPRRIAVGGDSAGGNLATVVSLRSRDEFGPAIALQAMVYPVTDLSSFDTSSYREFADGYSLTKVEMEWFRDHYLNQPEDGRSPHASPLLAPDLRGLPPALILTAEFDPLRDEAEAYAKRLQEAGVPVKCTRYPGMIHPFFSLIGGVRQSLEAIDEVAAAVASGRLR
ncbi:MAG TPA: alpha/beta hydrolase [Bryobacteraceae bacterium]|jgi:acetyl esterase